MERLTYRYGNNGEHAEFITKTRDGYLRYRASCEGALLLAAYEDIGLTPEEVVSLKAEITQLRDDYESVKNWNACEKEEYEKLLAETTRLREKTCWIPVHDRLPEEYKMILVWDGNVVLRAEYAQGKWYGVPDNTGFLPEQITQWLPLPEGPKED